ncbi:hypothetical protein TNCV_53071 [Trichonephila clavipes]|nr:hypothetical protein TNCV_53071 [Trichonephila clavipes]
MLWGRQVAGRNYPPTNKNTLIRALTEEWDKLPQQLLDNVVQSMVAATRDISRSCPLILIILQSSPHRQCQRSCILYEEYIIIKFS